MKEEQQKRKHNNYLHKIKLFTKWVEKYKYINSRRENIYTMQKQNVITIHALDVC